MFPCSSLYKSLYQIIEAGAEGQVIVHHELPVHGMVIQTISSYVTRRLTRGTTTTKSIE